jgi:hypothetical protein
VQHQKKLLSGLGDWLAVLLTFVVFAGMLLAMLSVLLGHAE